MNLGAAVMNLTRFTLAAGVSSATFLTVYYFKNRETVPFTNRTRFVLFSPTFERCLTNMLFDFEDHKSNLDVLPPTHPDSVRVKLVSDKIIKAAVHHYYLRMPTPIPPFDWEIVVVRDKEWTCYCYPGGKIVISTGTLQYLNTDIQLAWAIGHEVGHVIARHSAEELTKMLGFKLIFKLMYIILFLPFFIDKLSKPFLRDQRLSDVLFELPLSRRLELEADHIGLMLLASAGYYPREVPEIYEEIRRMIWGHWGDEYRNYLSTHPPLRKRSRLASQAMEEALAIYWKVISTCNDDELKLY